MLKVLLVDDEPFILQGIKVIIDWEKEGFEIAATAENGLEALEYLKKEKVDLIIADIRMPGMTGLELLEQIRREEISDAYFVILSGYAEFDYARRAMQNKCTEYLLKPVDRETLLKLLHKVRALSDRERQESKAHEEMEHAYFSRHLISLIHGKYDDVNLNYVKKHMKDTQGIRYVEIQKEQPNNLEEQSDKDLRNFQRELYDCCREFLKEDAKHCVFDVSADEKIYDIGFVYSENLAERLGMDDKTYLSAFRQYLVNNTKQPVIMLVGKKVPDISNVARSYGNACMLRSFQGFRARKEIYYYEDEVQVTAAGMVLCKQGLDQLLTTIEQNNHMEIRKAVEQFYEEMSQMGMNAESMNLNINYLLFQLIHLASEQDNDVNQEEILRLISESSFENGILRGSKAHMARFACEYGDYLSQLRKNVSRGVLGMIAGGEYPDFIEGGNGQMQLYDADALVALDDYLDDYPNIKNLFSDLEWEKLRQDDGHIYWIPQFSCIKNEEKVCTHNDEAFWIQARVLKWAGYPEIKTMDDYFNLIESYNEANPTMEDGTENIPYTILCDDWRYFCLENAPQFLDGYPNDGSCMVDPDTLTVLDYNTSDTAVAYFRKLNEEYQKGIVDPESFTQSYDEYISKLSTGRVLGMIDQWWDFSNANDAIKQAGLDEQGCDYIPVPVTIDGRDNQWHNSGGAFNESSGLAITTSCEDVEGALQFVNDLLDQDIHNLRFWGVEGTDYEVDENGEFYRTEEERTKQSDTAYKASHTCPYSYFPQYTGTSDDGINANKPDGQASEFFDGLNQDVKETFEAYGVETYVEMLGTNEAPGDWYPMWSFSNNFTTDTPGGVAWNKIADVKHEQLPQVVMAKDFDAAWDTYMDAYNACHPEDFISELQTELDTRMEQAAKFK